MRVFSMILISLSLSACTSPHSQRLQSLKYSPEDLKSPRRGIASTPTVHQKNPGYVSITVPLTAFDKIKSDLESSQNLHLKSRGEAHITVVTPPEFRKLSKKIAPEKIHALMDNLAVDKTSYKLLCVGKGEKQVKDKSFSTFYVVVESDGLFKVRKTLEELFLTQGGSLSEFNSENYFPHVTVGFTEKDLHLEDGVKKDASSCIYSLRADGTKQ